MKRKLVGVVIGAGQSGPSLAVRLAEAGQSVALVERRGLGGTCRFPVRSTHTQR